MALSTSRTLITKTGISTTQVFDMGGINIAGGDFNLGSAIKLGNASGIITATSFSGAFSGSISGDLSIDDKIVHTGDTDTTIRFPAADRISAEVAGSEKVRISSIGVGINTDSSLYHSGNSHLIVRGNNITSSSDDAIAAFHSGTAGKGQIRFTDGASGYHASQSWVEYDHSVAKFAIGWNAQTRAYGGPNNEFGLYYDTPSNLDSNAHELVIGGGTGSGGMTLFNSTSGQGNIFFADGIGSAAAKKMGRIVYDHSDNSMQFTANSTERLRINTDGVTVTGIVTTTQNVGNVGIDIHATGSGRGSQIKLHNDHATSFVGISGDTDGNLLIFNQSNTDIIFATSNNARSRVDSDGHFVPESNNTFDLGSTTLGWRNVYMNDLNLSNMNGDTNDVDGTQGSWTIQEGKDDLYIINRLNGKKFKIKMEEIN